MHFRIAAPVRFGDFFQRSLALPNERNLEFGINRELNSSFTAMAIVLVSIVKLVGDCRT